VGSRNFLPEVDSSLPVAHREGLAEPRSSTMARLKRYLSCVRYKECLVLQGTPLMGVAVSLGTIGRSELHQVLIFVIASFLVIAHIFGINDWADATSDAADSNKAAKAFLSKGSSRTEVRNISLGLGVASMVLFALLPWRTFLFAVAIAILGFAYSYHIVRTKGSPVFSSATHLVGGVIHFLMGYSLFGGMDLRGVALSSFFALTFTAGHLNQEVGDYEADRQNGVLTNAVRFGPVRAFVAGQVIFALAFACFLLLASNELMPSSLAWVALLYPVLPWSAWKTYRAGLTFENVSRFRTLYRALYAVIGLALLASLVLNGTPAPEAREGPSSRPLRQSGFFSEGTKDAPEL